MRSSSKPELASHLVEREYAAGLDVPFALAQRLERVLVLQDLERLLDRIVLLGRKHDRRGSAVARDDHMLVPSLDLVEELRKPSAGLGERDDSGHELKCTEL